jgi:hypothetical protein
MRETTTALDFFVGGVPPDVFFKLTYDDLCALVKSSSEKSFGSNTTAEVCLIGLAAHFEAFCKNQFAAIVNICPQVLSRFCERRPGTTIELKALLNNAEDHQQGLGFSLAEQYDFGSPKIINSLFYDVLGITLFSKKEGQKYSQFLNYRNLLVHHGGIYTSRYEPQLFTRRVRSGQQRVHFDSIVIRRDNFNSWAKFLVGMGEKISTASYNALSKFVADRQIHLEPEQKTAVETFLRLAWTT